MCFHYLSLAQTHTDDQKENHENDYNLDQLLVPCTDMSAERMEMPGGSSKQLDIL